MANPEQPEQFPQEKQEPIDEKIVEHNLRMLKKDMHQVLNSESIGGNAGSIEVEGKRYPCVATNGYVDSKTGEIVAFGNFQNIDKETVKNSAEITLRISFFDGKIVDFFGKEKISQEGLQNIEKAIEQYNIDWQSKSKK